MDNSWNGSAEPLPPKKGMPTWGKVMMGCGLLVLLALGTCIIGGVYAFKKGSTALVEVTQKPMQEFAALVREGGTAEGLARFYQQNPELAKRYPDAASFAETFKNLPERVGPIPTRLENLISLMKENRLELKAENENGHKTMTLKYRNPGKEALRGRWDDGKLMDLEIE